MRAVCENCEQLQPIDWQAGDLCGHCGHAVRRDVRCFWCATWTPLAKFCRSCGAAVVDDRLYGAARMIKDAGTDRFSVPRLLTELDPEQIENFTRLYQRHAIAVARHTDELRFVERFLRQKRWSAAMEDELAAQLPWSNDLLGRYSGRPLPAGDDLQTIKAIQASTPFEQTRTLAALARLRLDDWSAYRDADSALLSGDETIRAEAALILSSWRVRTAVGPYRDSRMLVEELRRSPFKSESAVRLASLGRPPQAIPRELLEATDPETAFEAALLLGDVDRLSASLRGDSLERIAAGCALARLGVAAPLAGLLQEGPDTIRLPVVDALATGLKSAVPELNTILLQIVETTDNRTLRERAARVLSRACPPGAALRIARAASGDRSIFQTLLQTPGLSPESLSEIADFLIENGLFSMNQYGLPAIAENGRVPDTFVPSRFAHAGDATKQELLRFAEVQLGQRGDEALHRFVLNVVFAAAPAATRAAAWWVLHRWYMQQGEHRGEGPFRLDRESLERFVAPLDVFLAQLAAVLRDHASLKQVGLFEFLANLFSTATPSGIEAIQAEEGAAHALVRALLEAIRGDYWPQLIDGMIAFLGRLGAHPLWRDEVIAGLESVNRQGNYHYDKALGALELSKRVASAK